MGMKDGFKNYRVFKISFGQIKQCTALSETNEYCIEYRSLYGTTSVREEWDVSYLRPSHVFGALCDFLPSLPNIHIFFIIL